MPAEPPPMSSDAVDRAALACAGLACATDDRCIEPRQAGIDVEGIELAAVRALPRDVEGTVNPSDLWSTLDAMNTAALDDHDQLEVIAAWDRLATAAAHRRLEASVDFQLTPYAGTRERREFAADEIAVRTGAWSRGVQRDLDTGYTLRDRLPLTRGAASTGRLTATKATLIAHAAFCGDRSMAAILEGRVLDRAAEQNPSSLRRTLQRALIDIDPAAAEVRRRRALHDRHVSGTPLDDGMADLHARVSGYDWVVINSAVNAAAHGLKTAGDPRTLDQLRADALVAPFLNALHTGVLDGMTPLTLAKRRGTPTQIHVTVPASVLMGLSDSPGHLQGYGPITAAAARLVATDAQWRRIVTDPATGAVVDVSTKRYSPPDALGRLVETRDGTCRFPGCGVRATNCDLDHTLPHPRGETSAANLGALCRRHHRLKHQVPGLRLTQDGSGRFTWTMPTGHEHRVDPPRTGSDDDQYRGNAPP